MTTPADDTLEQLLRGPEDCASEPPPLPTTPTRPVSAAVQQEAPAAAPFPSRRLRHDRARAHIGYRCLGGFVAGTICHGALVPRSSAARPAAKRADDRHLAPPADWLGGSRRAAAQVPQRRPRDEVARRGVTSSRYDGAFSAGHATAVPDDQTIDVPPGTAQTLDRLATHVSLDGVAVSTFYTPAPLIFGDFRGPRLHRGRQPRSRRHDRSARPRLPAPVRRADGDDRPSDTRAVGTFTEPFYGGVTTPLVTSRSVRSASPKVAPPRGSRHRSAPKRTTSSSTSPAAARTPPDRARNLVERFFNKIKQCRRVATRYDKLAANYLAFIQLASIRLWLRAL